MAQTPAWRVSASRLFAAARGEAAKLPTALQAQDLSYIANEEALEGLPAGDDFEASFSLARALPARDAGVKAQLEHDAVDGLLRQGQMDTAEELARKADAGKAAILDRLIPAAIAAGRLVQAQSIWMQVTARSAVPAFVAARTLLASDLPAAPRAKVLREGLEATDDAAGPVEADAAIDFLQAARGTSAGDRDAVATAALRLATRMNGMHAPGWEITSLRARLREVVAATAPQELGGFDRDASLPPLQARPSAAATPQPPRSAALEPAPARAAPKDTSAQEFESMVWVALSRDPDLARAAYGEQVARKALKMVNRETAEEMPEQVARLAAACFELRWPKRQQWALRLALDEAVRRANALRPGDAISLGTSPTLAVFGIAAEIDFLQARARAQALHDGPMKPLVLARVARMAKAAAQLRPGQTVTVLH